MSNITVAFALMIGLLGAVFFIWLAYRILRLFFGFIRALPNMDSHERIGKIIGLFVLLGVIATVIIGDARGTGDGIMPVDSPIWFYELSSTQV